jgi:hypothetical protein
MKRLIIIILVLCFLFSALAAEEKVRTYYQFLGKTRKDIDNEIQSSILRIYLSSETDDERIVLQYTRYGYQVFLWFNNDDICHSILLEKVFKEEEKAEMKASIAKDQELMKADGWKLTRDYVNDSDRHIQVFTRNEDEEIKFWYNDGVLSPGYSMTQNIKESGKSFFDLFKLPEDE